MGFGSMGSREQDGGEDVKRWWWWWCCYQPSNLDVAYQVNNHHSHRSHQTSQSTTAIHHRINKMEAFDVDYLLPRFGVGNLHFTPTLKLPTTK